MVNKRCKTTWQVLQIFFEVVNIIRFTFAPMMNKAFIFDLNGTVIDDMRFHAIAWREIINGELKGDLTHEQVKQEMYGKNEEVLQRIFGKEKFTLDEMNAISKRKEDAYQEAYKPHVALIKGLEIFLEKAYQLGIPMAIGSAAIPYNIDFILDILNLRKYFPVIVSADDVTTSKPHPETFVKAAQLLGVAPEHCIVFEDAPKGVEAAQNAGMKAVTLTTTHEREDFAAYTNVLFFTKDYTDAPFAGLLK